MLSLSGKGFKVSAATETCTKGIWIWSRPVYSEKENMYIFFLDSEGGGSTTKDEEFDIKIFSLSVLVSSYFIYNTYGVINESTIN